jgi:hypothetical protein
MLASSLVWNVKLGSFGSSFWNLHSTQYPFDRTSTKIEPLNLLFATTKSIELGDKSLMDKILIID